MEDKEEGVVEDAYLRQRRLDLPNSRADMVVVAESKAFELQLVEIQIRMTGTSSHVRLSCLAEVHLTFSGATG